MELTAVEWLAQYLKSITDLNCDDIIEHALQTEKNQHDKTAEDWWKEGAHYMKTQGQHQNESFDKYFEERFKK